MKTHMYTVPHMDEFVDLDQCSCEGDYRREKVMEKEEGWCGRGMDVGDRQCGWRGKQARER
jgi:hypothetical protein